MLINTSQLDAQQLKDLADLKRRCAEKDTYVPSLYSHILSLPRSLPSTFLYYENKQLLGFLSAFFFYEHAVEVTVLVDPQVRRQGIAKQLLRAVIPLIQTYGYPSLIFSSPADTNDVWLNALGFTYQHSEYHMKREALQPVLEYRHDFPVRPMQESEIPNLITLDTLCFEKTQPDAQERYQHLMQEKAYRIFVGLQHNTPIGKAHMRWDEKEATLSDITVHPSLQGQGIGTALIAQCINHALADGKSILRLDVETKNQKALTLYTRLGFVVENSCDFWRIDMKALGELDKGSI